MRVSVLFFWDGQKLIEQCVALWYDFGGTKKETGLPSSSFHNFIYGSSDGFAKIHGFWVPVMQVPSKADCTAFVHMIIMPQQGDCQHVRGRFYRGFFLYMS